MKATLKLTALACLAAATLNGCAHIDNAMSTIDDTLNGASDVASGDLRAIAGKKPTTLGEIWKDWKANEVSAQKKWSSQTLLVPGVIVRITASSSMAGGDKLVVIFKDPKNPKCVASANTRDALLVNQKRISNLKAGDRVTVSGVLADTASILVDNTCNFVFDKAKISKEA